MNAIERTPRSTRARHWTGLAGASLFVVQVLACATTSTIHSEPPGAKLYINGKHVGETPHTMSLNNGFLSSASYKARLELDGYQIRKTLLAQDWNYGWLAADFICLGALPAIWNGQSHRESYSIELVSLADAPASLATRSPPPSSAGLQSTSAVGSAPSYLDGTKIAVLPVQLDASAKAIPDLIDDYVMTAVQSAGNFDVVGREDIAAMLGFEKQRDLLDCSDTSCMADLGGALGVDRIVGLKIARLDENWIVTAKIINIRVTRVEARVNQIIVGTTTQLLQAMPGIIAKLFASLPPSV